MKNFVKLIGIIALVAVTGFSMIACGGGGGGGSPSVKKETRDPITYIGTADGDTYTLEIKDSGARAALTPESGDKYTLTKGSKTSTGDVESFTGGKLKLVPSNAEEPFEVTVSSEGITDISGTITWDEGEPEKAPEKITPSGNSGSPSGGPSGSGGGKSITITGISGLTGEGELWISPDADGEVMTAGGEVTISGSSVTVNLFIYDNEEYEYTTTAYTGSGSFYVFIGAEKDWYVTKTKKSISAANTTIPWSDFKEAEW